MCYSRSARCGGPIPFSAWFSRATTGGTGSLVWPWLAKSEGREHMAGRMRAMVESTEQLGCAVDPSARSSRRLKGHSGLVPGVADAVSQGPRAVRQGSTGQEGKTTGSEAEEMQHSVARGRSGREGEQQGERRRRWMRRTHGSAGLAPGSEGQARGASGRKRRHVPGASWKQPLGALGVCPDTAAGQCVKDGWTHGWSTRAPEHHGPTLGVRHGR